LEIRCFGRFEVLREGVAVRDWRRTKARTMLKYLVDRRHPVARDVLIDLLWPESEPRAANNSLRVTLHALRQVLGSWRDEANAEQEYVVLDDGNFFLNPAARPRVDVEEFAIHFETGFRLERRQRVAEALREYEAAEALYRDDYLIEDLYEDWSVARREQLKDQYLLLVTRLADHCLHEGDALGCIVRCHRILQKDPCREDAYRLMMRSYLLLGQRSQALHWYDICARTLRKELDVEPAEPTERLYLYILGGRTRSPASADLKPGSISEPRS
jgi:DNA-binding SARP family transcriptional activator